MTKRRKTILKKRTLNALKRMSAVVVAVSVVLGQLPIYTAYEAHVINVIARIDPCQYVTIEGVKFNDANGNGVRDGGEAGLKDWIIELKGGPYAPEYDYNGNVKNDSNDYGILEDVIVDGATCPLGTICDFNGDGSLALASGDLTAFQNWLAARDFGNQMTDENGHYIFPTQLKFGDYIVTEVTQTGWTATTPVSVALTTDECTEVVNFGNKRNEILKGGLSGYKWHDINHDGTWQQPAEPPIAGWLMALTGDSSGLATTDATGYYAFTNLNAGSYTVTEETRSGWLGSTPTSTTVTLAQGETKTGVNFGNYQTGVCQNAITLDFENDASGNPMLKGQFIDTEYSLWGILVSAHNYNAAHPQKAIIFDSAHPSGGINGDKIVDVDLGTPNLQFGGPGNSENGDGKEPSNNTPLHNLLIIPDNAVDTTPADGYVDDPNDEPAGGSIRFVFNEPMTFSSVKYIDLDHGSNSAVVGYSDATGTAQVFSIPVPAKNGNSVQKISGDQTTKIRMLKLRGYDSFGIDEVVLCPPLPYCGDGKVNLENEQCDDGNLVNGDGCDNDCTVSSQCGNGRIEKDEVCDDGNLVNGDGCENDCKPTTFCGDGAVQTPNSYGQNEQCDDGARNGTLESTCTKLCQPQQNQCEAKSQGYFKNNDGCNNGTGTSIWATQVNTLSDGLSDVFATTNGNAMCVQLAVNCTTSTSNDVDKARCDAKKFTLADEMNAVSSHLRTDALVAGGYDGNTAFTLIGISATTTIQHALTIMEQVIADPGSTKTQLADVQYIAARIYTFYEKENTDPFECVLPGMGNGIVEPGEQCDDGNLAPWDGCSPTGTSEVVLNEIMANPTGSDGAPMPAGEWVELFNLSTRPISLEGWALYDKSNSNVLPITATSTTVATTTIAAGGRLVVYRNGNTKFEMTNSGDRVRLYNAQISVGGDLLDAFEWTTAKPEGNSYARVPDGTGSWVDPCPTLGEENVDVMCDGTPADEAVIAPELIAASAAEEPPQAEDIPPDAATLTDEQWAALFPEEDPVVPADSTIDSPSSSKTEEQVTDPTVVIQPTTGSGGDTPPPPPDTTNPEVTPTSTDGLLTPTT
ncbi:MAG: lamin tail domain-containing protein [Patescibacteria group bacterium]|nr:lamin tail domain-containing protein [Patescibacteria group bacterium]